MIEIQAPNKLEVPEGYTSIFLAGSIELGVAELWQERIVNSLRDDNVVLFNPRRDDWDCVDSETKCITKNGIKAYNELTEGDLILTYNIEKDILEYDKINKLNIYELSNEEILEFKRDNDLFYFTKNHNFISRKSSRNNSIDIYPANKWVARTDSVRTPSNKKINNLELNKLFDTEFGDDHFKLYAWLLSEGSIFKRNDCDTYNIVIAQFIKNELKVGKIEDILKRLNFEYRYDNRMFTLVKEGVDFILGFMGFEKYVIPDWIKAATPEQKRIFILEYALGDGTYVDEKVKSIYFSAKYRKFAEEFQILCYEAGVSTKLRDKTSGFGHPVISLTIHDFDKLWYTMKYNNTINYSGIVWCPSTNNKTWVAYRNGSPFITGNSSWKQEKENRQFREQVEWELDALEKAHIIAMYFDPNTKSPISLLELGLHSREQKMVVLCPKGFWRKGNVDIVCEKYNIKQVESFEELIETLKSLIK